MPTRPRPWRTLSKAEKRDTMQRAAKFVSDVAKDTDPHSIPQHEPGAKLDANKPRMGLVLLGFANALTEVSKVGTYGAKKYSDYGWQHVPNGYERYTDAMFRHVFIEDGTYDESGFLHDAHAAWCALARLELRLRSMHDEVVASPDDLA